MEQVAEQAWEAGVSPLDFEQMTLAQVVAAIRGYDRRMRSQARVLDALAYKLIRGLAMAKPQLVPFERLFPGWEEETLRRTLTPAELAQQNAARLEEWCDRVEGE